MLEGRSALLRRSVSDPLLLQQRSDAASLCRHLIRADPPPRTPPLLRLDYPLYAPIASFSSKAEAQLVDLRLHATLKQRAVSASRRKVFEYQQQQRDYEAGRSPPPSAKSAKARDALYDYRVIAQIDQEDGGVISLPEGDPQEAGHNGAPLGYVIPALRGGGVKKADYSLKIVR